jgi:hypothetical protein
MTWKFGAGSLDEARVWSHSNKYLAENNKTICGSQLKSNTGAKCAAWASITCNLAPTIAGLQLIKPKKETDYGKVHASRLRDWAYLWGL